jgi:micrococcal nuclease
MFSQHRPDSVQWLLLLILFVLSVILLIMVMMAWMLFNQRENNAATQPAEQAIPLPAPPMQGSSGGDSSDAQSSSPDQSQPSVSFDFPITWAVVDSVLDGDTVRMSDGQRVRYIGMDTPESESNPPECYALEASEKNRRLVEGKRVALRKDKGDLDRYGRLLRYVYLEDGRFVNQILVVEGYATAAAFKPNLLFQTEFTQWEAEARGAKRGMWQKCAGKS